MELDWLQTFLAVVDRGGFTAAAEQLHRSQSRVSAHIAALERDLGVRLIDRSHRPATLTSAGEVFAGHAREIVAGVGSARSAVGALRGLEQGTLTALTTPCVATALFPAVLARMAQQHPGIRVGVAEQSRQAADRGPLTDGIAVAVVPRRVAQPVAAPRGQPLWHEGFRLVVRTDHDLAARTAAVPVPLGRMLRHPLVVVGSAVDTEEPEVERLLADAGAAAWVRATVDTPQTLLALVRAGVGAGVVNAVALEPLDTSGLAVLDIEGDVLAREVVAYWSAVLLAGPVGRDLRRAVLDAPTPLGATRAAALDAVDSFPGTGPVRE